MTSHGNDSTSTLISAEVDENSTKKEISVDDGFNYVTGWRLHFITIGMALSIFLVNLESTIVSTSLVSITDEFHDFGASSWIITAFLITYTGGVVIWAKLSDMLGRKATLIASLVIFCAFSGGCGLSRGMNQLIACRAFQGIGGGGIYALISVMLYELVPPPRYPLYSTLISTVVALSPSLGPIVGGVILQGASWRWVFLFNVPAAAVAVGIFMVAVPRDFPYQGKDKSLIPQRGLATADFTGAVLMVSVLALLIVAFEQAATSLSWTTSTFIGTLCAAIVTLVAFLGSQWYASRPGSVVEPVLPWRFCQSRLIMGLLLCSFIGGAVNIACIIQIPIRYQTAVGGSPLQAGLRLAPLAISQPVGNMMTVVIVKNRRMPPLYLSLIGQLMQIIGLVFLCRGPSDDPDWVALYGIEVITGLGMGFMTVGLLTPSIIGKRDIAVGSASVNQFRLLGSTIVVAIITAVGNSWVRDELLHRLTPPQVSEIFQSTAAINDLPETAKSFAQAAFVKCFNLQMEIVLCFAVVGVFTWLLMWQKPQIRIP